MPRSTAADNICSNDCSSLSSVSFINVFIYMQINIPVKLFELFDNPMRGVTSKGDDHTFFIDGDGPYTVHIIADEYLDFSEEASEWMNHQIADREPDIRGLAFYYQNSGSITGIQNPYKVFATVLDIIKKYVAEHNVDFIVFESKTTEPSRVKLYHRMAQKLGKDFRAFEDPWDSVMFVVRV